MTCKECKYCGYSCAEDKTKPYYYCSVYKMEVYKNQGECREFEKHG